MDCFLCSVKELDYPRYNQHLANFHKVQAGGEEVLLALHFLKEKDRTGLINQTKTEVTKFKESEDTKRSPGQAKSGLKETTIEELVEAREAEKPKNKHLRVGGTQFRKRKSMVAIQHDAVSSKVKMFSQVVNPLSTSTPAPISVNSSKIRTGMKSSISSRKLLIEKKPEALVNEILIKTLEEHRSGQKTANDTISCFDEIFATNCPSDLDESYEDKVEGPFNLLLEEEEEQSNPEGGPGSPPSQASTREIQDQEEDNLEIEEGNTETKGEVKEIEKLKESKEESKETQESLKKFEEAEGGEEAVDGGEEEEVRYSCESCGKRFKFLTYLKGHQSSKANCNSKEIKKKRQSMNVSRLGSF